MAIIRRSLAFLIILCLSSTALLAQKTAEQKFQEKLERYQELKPQLYNNSNTSAHKLFLDHEEPEAHWTTRNTGSNQLSSFLIDDVLIDSQDRQIFISSRSVDIYDGTNWSHLDFGEDIPYPVNDIIEDVDNNFWLLTTGKVYKMSSDFSMMDSVSIPEDDSVSNSYRTGIIDNEGQLWLSHNATYDYNDQNELVLTKQGGVSVYHIVDERFMARMDTVDSGLEGSIMANGVNDFTRDADGNVWGSVTGTDTTSAGLAVFNADLHSANNYRSSNSDLPEATPLYMERDNEGNIWTSFSDAVQRAAYFDGSDWTTFTNSVDELAYTCRTLEVADDGQLYCGNDSTTVAYDGSAWTTLQETAADQNFSDISAISSGPSGVTAFVKRTGSNQGTLRSGIFLRDGDEFQYMSTHSDNGLFSDIIFGLAADDEGGLWASGFYGASYYDGSDWTFYNANDGLANSYSWKMHVGDDGTVWFGTAGGGITYLQDGEFTVNNEYGTFVETIFEDSNENIWMGSYSANGILQYDGSEFTHHDTLRGVIGIYVTSIAEGPDGNIYAGGNTPGDNYNAIAQYDGEEWTAWTPDSSEQFDPWEIASDADNNLWFNGDSLMKWDGETLTEIAYPTEDFASSAVHIEPDPDGNIWASYNSGVWVYNTTSEEWLNPLPDPGNLAYDIVHDNQGNTWISTYGGGIYQFNRSQTVPTEPEKEIPESFTLEQNYPNPFNPTTNITYNLPEGTNNLTVKVYNVLGKEVATLVNAQSQSAGRHQVSFDASGLSSGVYIYRVESDQFTASKKMMLIK